MARRYAREISWDEFVARVRRHRPSELVPALAAAAIGMADRDIYMRERLRMPWALAAAAKVSLIDGNEHRGAGVADQDVREICAAHNAVREPLGDDVEAGSLAAFLTRIANEQFRYQIAPMNEIARAQLLYVDAANDTADLEVYSPSVLADRVLGCDLTSFEGVGFMFGAGAKVNGGYFDLSWYDQPNFTNIAEVIPRTLAVRVMDDHFAASRDELRAMAARTAGPAKLAKHAFNPLVGTPFVKWDEGRWLAPQPTFIFWKLFADSIYYAGARELGQAFTNDVGRLFETYVGSQLKQIPDAHVIGEIVYEPDQRSTDWFIVWDELVVLVEAKATRLTQGARVGMPELGGGFERAVGRAFGQITKTEQLLRDSHPAFAEIPLDRPRHAIVATLDSYWMANSPVMQEMLATPAPPIPTKVLAARELEGFVSHCLAGGGSRILPAIDADEEARTTNVELALAKLFGEAPRNPLLEEAWQRLPWRRATETTE